MASPCVRDTTTTTMSQDGSGDVGVDLKIHASDSGIGVVADGVYVNNYPGGGIVRTANGLFGRQYYAHVGWYRGVNDVAFPGTAVGAGGYVQVNPVLGLNFARQGPASQYMHISCGAEMGMILADNASQNPYFGWTVGLEVWYDFAPTWVELASEAMGGYSNGAVHQLFGNDWFVISDDAVHQVLVRMILRGGLNGTSICSSTAKKFIHLDYH